MKAARAGPQATRRPLQRRVLVVDDEQRIRQVLSRILEAQGVVADVAADGREAVAMASAGCYDLVILDLLMPELDGFSALREIMRRRPNQAVLVLSCLTDPESKMASLGLGADDYLPKPFHVGELVARIQARLRAAARPGPAALSCGRLTLDVLHRQADAGAGPVPLTSREFQLLWEFMREPGSVLSKSDLLARVWGEVPDSMSNVVDAYIRRLRSRLGAEVITTVRGEGYCVSPD